MFKSGRDAPRSDNVCVSTLTAAGCDSAASAQTRVCSTFSKSGPHWIVCNCLAHDTTRHQTKPTTGAVTKGPSTSTPMDTQPQNPPTELQQSIRTASNHPNSTQNDHKHRLMCSSQIASQPCHANQVCHRVYRVYRVLPRPQVCCQHHTAVPGMPWQRLTNSTVRLRASSLHV